ncbi:uncharacterized protein [Linepithema humile]|uniref:uncharacterized protein isoform X2 n=1 Tax=Linepithema humile TaxID=83485 RepID=UPI00351E0F46
MLSSDVFCLKWVLLYGRALLAGAASFTGAYINLRFRRKLKLRDYGLFPTMLGLTAAPAITTSLSYSEVILRKLLLLDITCPLCLESKAAILQTFTGLVLPLMLTPIANFAVTSGSGVFNTPHYSDMKGIFKIVSSTYKPMLPKIATLFTLHVLLANVITYLQIKSFIRIKDIQYIMKLENKDALHVQ